MQGAIAEKIFEHGRRVLGRSIIGGPAGAGGEPVVTEHVQYADLRQGYAHEPGPLCHRRAYQETAFAAFDGTNQEPIDGRGQFVDMNGNGKRDPRESVAQAWTRLGLLKAGERLTHGKYVACVAAAAAKLVDQGFLPPRMLPYYVNRAATSGVGEAEN